MKIISIRQLPLTLLLCAIASPVMASTPLEAASASEINVANELVEEGKFDEALESYRQIQPTSKTKEELNYNIAVAEYRKGETEAAKTLFTEVSASPQSALAAAARYNLGNCFYADAVAQAEQDRPAAIEALQQAIQHYRGSLAVDANQVDARANIELAMEFLKKLKQEQKQEQEQQQKENQEQNQENKDQQKQDSESQDSESMKNDSQQDQESKEKPNESKSDPQSQEGSEQKEEKPFEESQKNPGEQNEQPQPEQDPSQSMNPQSKSPKDQAKPEEQSPGEKSEEEPSSKEDQPVPSGELKAANEEDQSQQPSGQVGVNDPNAKETPMSKEEALKMLQAVRDRDFLRRLRQEQKERRRHIPTDRDW
ncbi:tetratricopeptide repeat protein [Rubinisphaera italica]|uniref:Tetratricopeptide repeat protein n=1 Tax=Rubinisphaera italica TaxID=2527969 RepID=A0A5C5XMS1_9PLAN|nr:tetratricopeptide repeat protein [Rubinisphaera italica]TWT63395.1 hypothetical protein Pan54_41480 [Rubinisphaera italica]